jgi:hypothetical protein
MLASGTPTSGNRGWLRGIDEPAVSLTDYGLALESTLFALMLSRGEGHTDPVRRWSAVFFTATALASVAGGTDHGFCRRKRRENAHAALWTATMLAIGGSAQSLIRMSTALDPRPRAARSATSAVMVYGALVISGRREFQLTLLAHVPAALLFVHALAQRWRSGEREGVAHGIAAILVSLAGAAGQRLRIGVHPTRLDHNALYHVVQAVAFALLCRCTLETGARNTTMKRGRVS